VPLAARFPLDYPPADAVEDGVSKRWIGIGGVAAVLIGGLTAGLLAAPGGLLSTPGLANGVMGADAPSRIPKPARSFSATFIDVGGTEVQGTSKVTFNGEVFLYGRYGAGQVTVPFERISEVRIEKAKDPLKRTAIVTLNDGSDPVRIVVEDDTAWYAHTRFGNYKAEVRELAKIRGFKLIPKSE